MIDLPLEKGARISIQSSDQPGRRYVEWHGFVMESGNAQTYIMRREYPAGLFGGSKPDTLPTQPIQIL
jgi:hypothetical protein